MVISFLKNMKKNHQISTAYLIDAKPSGPATSMVNMFAW
jgi:hypothetical protein